MLLGALLPFIDAEIAMDGGERGRLLAAFSSGYMLTQVAGGAASDRLGGKLLILVKPERHRAPSLDADAP